MRTCKHQCAGAYGQSLKGASADAKIKRSGNQLRNPQDQEAAKQKDCDRRAGKPGPLPCLDGDAGDEKSNAHQIGEPRMVAGNPRDDGYYGLPETCADQMLRAKRRNCDSKQQLALSDNPVEQIHENAPRRSAHSAKFKLLCESEECWPAGHL